MSVVGGGGVGEGGRVGRSGKEGRFGVLGRGGCWAGEGVVVGRRKGGSWVVIVKRGTRTKG